MKRPNRLWLWIISMAAALIIGSMFIWAAPGNPLNINNKLNQNFKAEELTQPSNLPEIALTAIKNGIKPATFQNLQYQLAPGVEWLDEQSTRTIVQKSQNGRIAKDLLPRWNLTAPKTFIHRDTGVMLTFIPEGNQLDIQSGADQDVLAEITLPLQKVPLNAANIFFVAPGVQVQSRTQKSANGNSGEGFTYTFNKQKTLPGYDQEDKKIEVALEGALFIQNPTLEAEYSKNGGYRFVFHGLQTADVKARLLMDIKKEVKIPITGYKIDSDVCKVNIGVFLVLGVDGEITMECRVSEQFRITAGFRGDTDYYIPTSVKKVCDVDFEINEPEITLDGKVQGLAAVSAEISCKVLGKANVTLTPRIGLKVDAAMEKSDTEKLDVKGKAFFDIQGKVAYKSFDKKKKLYSNEYPLFHYYKEKGSRYQVVISEACAFRDLISGEVLKIVDLSGNQSPYQGAVEAKITALNGQTKIVSATTDARGRFQVGYDLKNGDTVQARPALGDTKWGSASAASFPFTSIRLDQVSFLQGKIQGEVCGAPQSQNVYSGTVNFLIRRSRALPFKRQSGYYLPVNYTLRKSVSCRQGKFCLEGVELWPGDEVRAYIEYDGFQVISESQATEGLDIRCEGQYRSQDKNLHGENLRVWITADAPVPLNVKQATVTVSVMNPHNLNQKTVYSRKWEVALHTTPQGLSGQISDFDLPLGNQAALIASVNKPNLPGVQTGTEPDYHAYIQINYIYQGKNISSFQEVVQCQQEKRKNALNELALLQNFNNPRAWSAVLTKAGSPLINPVGKEPDAWAVVNLRDSQAADQADGGMFACSYQISEPGQPARTYQFYLRDQLQKIDTGSWRYYYNHAMRRKLSYQVEFGISRGEIYDLNPDSFQGIWQYKGTENVRGMVCQIWIAGDLKVWETEAGYFSRIQLSDAQYQIVVDLTDIRTQVQPAEVLAPIY